MNKILTIFFVVITFTSCSEYQKAMKSDDLDLKKATATSLYENQKYTKAISLFEQISPSLKGKPDSEQYFYMLSKSYYETEQYYLAGFSLEKFVSDYPKSEKKEEAAFLSAQCFFKLSPVYSLDQADTYKALDKLQAFIDTYPNSEYMPMANNLVKELTDKIEFKAFEVAKQYNLTAEHYRDFNAPIKVFDIFLADYPGTKYKEDALYYKFDTHYKFALNSVESKKQERLKNAKAAYETLLKFNSDTKYKKIADKQIAIIEKELTLYSNN
ncbi:MAG TPA: outer membrane protein assembly factor BamD [Flavobacterium sp.]|nr:outer membrane protein assembly factor BamD [Flavobacterium sp.]